MTADADYPGLDALLGDAAMGRLTGVGPRDRRRLRQGREPLYPQTADALRARMEEALRLAGGATAEDAEAVLAQIAAALPRCGPMALRIGLRLALAPGAIPRAEVIRDFGGGDGSASAPDAALRRLEAAGLIEADRPTAGYGASVRWRPRAAMRHGAELAGRLG